MRTSILIIIKFEYVTDNFRDTASSLNTNEETLLNAKWRLVNYDMNSGAFKKQLCFLVQYFEVNHMNL